MPPPPEGAIGRRHVALAGYRGDEAVARRALSDPDARIRATGLGALGRMDALELTDLHRPAADPSAIVRARAAELAGALGARAIPLLVRLLDDPDAAVVEAACFALGETGGPPGEGAVARLAAVVTDHGDPVCREAAVAALGALGDPAGVPAILGALSDKPAVRRRAVLALAPFDGPEVDAALERALRDRDWQVRQAAEDLTDRARGYYPRPIANTSSGPPVGE